MPRNNWTRPQLIVAFNLYCKIPFGKIHAGNPDIQELAPIIGRSANALSMKLSNFASFDPVLQARGIKGLSASGKGDKEIWDEFSNNWDELAFESERILAEYKGVSIEAISEPEVDYIPREGLDRMAIVKLRVNQNFFRKTVLASYNHSCCITGISIPELLVAGHIIPWSADTKNRVNPSNGLCLNALHDRAFDKGLITITPDLTLKLSDKILDDSKFPQVASFFTPYAGKKIAQPNKFQPLAEFLDWHNGHVFQG